MTDRYPQVILPKQHVSMDNNFYKKLYDDLVAGFAKEEEKAALPFWWQEMKRQGEKTFIQKGLPTNKSEIYRYTPIKARWLTSLGLELPGAPVTATDITSLTSKVARLPGYHLLLCNTEIKILSPLPVGITAKLFTDLDNEEETIIETYYQREHPLNQDPFVALNSAYCQEGLFFTIQPDIQLDQPIYLHHYTTSICPAIAHPRIFLHLGLRSRAQFTTITYTPDDLPLWVNGVTNIVLSKEATLDYCTLQLECSSQTHFLNYTAIMQQENSSFNSYLIAFAKNFLYNHLVAQFMEKKSQAHFAGAYLGLEGGHIENYLQLIHEAPKTKSATYYKGALGHSSRGVFHGDIQITPTGKKTEATQQHHSWTLCDDASLYARPQLRIENNDVLCSHGATISQPTEETYSWLRTRGIPLEEGRKMVLFAFLEEQTRNIPIAELKKYLGELLWKQVGVL